MFDYALLARGGKGAVGAAVGGVVGGAVGAAVGAAVGGAVGGAMHPKFMHDWIGATPFI